MDAMIRRHPLSFEPRLRGLPSFGTLTGIGAASVVTLWKSTCSLCLVLLCALLPRRCNQQPFPAKICACKSQFQSHFLFGKLLASQTFGPRSNYILNTLILYDILIDKPEFKMQKVLDLNMTIVCDFMFNR